MRVIAKLTDKEIEENIFFLFWYIIKLINLLELNCLQNNIDKLYYY